MIPPPVSGGQGPRKYFKVFQSASCDFVVTFNHHFHITHNIPCLTPKFCMSSVINFSLRNTQEKLETVCMHCFFLSEGVEGLNEVYYGQNQNGQ